MIRDDARFARAVEETVRALERETDAEIVVVVARRSGSYRDVAVGAGFAAAWFVLLFLLFSPAVFHPVWIAVELPVSAGVAAWLVHRSPWLLPRLASKGRRKRQVAEAAHAAFHEEAVHGTRGRTGLLVYLSLLEDHVVLVPDAGLERHIAGAEWNSIRWGGGKDPAAPGDLEHFIEGLRAVGRTLARHVPPDGANPNEMPDEPRFRR